MNTLIQLIVNGIIRQEGEAPDATNPGNLRGAPWLVNPQMLNGYWVSPSRAAGVAGIAHVAALHVAQGNTLRDFIAGHPGVYAGFAPWKDHNDPETYISNLVKWCGIPSADEPMWNFIL